MSHLRKSREGRTSTSKLRGGETPSSERRNTRLKTSWESSRRRSGMQRGIKEVAPSRKKNGKGNVAAREGGEKLRTKKNENWNLKSQSNGPYNWMD